MVLKNIAHSRPFLGEAEAAAAGDAIRTGHIAQGKSVSEFERSIAGLSNRTYAAATSSGTAALHLTLLAMGICEGDEVILPSFVCSALLNAVRYTAAYPVLADIDPHSFNIDPQDAAQRITSRTRAIIVPHLFGRPADLEGLLALGVPVIEDCAQSIGGRYQNKPLGSRGDAAVFSFYATKMMATGEGGMVVSDSKPLIDQVRYLRQYDKDSEGRLRFNYKMTDMQAAVGLVQLDRLTAFVSRRREIAKRYHDAFRFLDPALMQGDLDSVYYRYTIMLDNNEAISFWMDRLQKKGVESARPVFQPIHRLIGRAGFPHSDQAWQCLLSIPIYPALTDQEVDQVIQAVKETYVEVCRG